MEKKDQTKLNIKSIQVLETIGQIEKSNTVPKFMHITDNFM